MCDYRGSFFFFKQKTAYEMRISDWSSDVCSSDLSFRRSLWNMERSLVTPYLQELVPLRRRFGYGDKEGNRIQGRHHAAAGGELSGADGEVPLAGDRKSVV